MNYKVMHFKHVFDFRITKHINTNHDNIVSFDFFLNLIALTSYSLSKSFFLYTIKYVCLLLLGFFKKEKKYCQIISHF